MPVLQYVHLDVFTNQPFTGNQLAVFLDAEGIDERRMQRIANEVALPETTFVFPPEGPGTDARVRIFTPSQELPMAGSAQDCPSGLRLAIPIPRRHCADRACECPASEER
jgi:PhzF family phenazine biosynthesis protein